MAIIPIGTRFIGISPTVNLTERKSSLINRETEPFTIEDINADAVGQSIYANGFVIAGAINTDIVLPDNSTINYTGPLSMGAGYTLTIPANTTLNIL
jgi:hypothetical protein